MQNNTFSTLFVGQNLIRLSAVDSTNSFLKMMASNSEPLAEGTVIMADHQFAGRGQHGNVWYAEAGLNLTFSLFLRPVFLAVNEQFMLNMAISVALNTVLNRVLQGNVKIKWPNDIFYADRKLGGVLIENMISGNSLKASIIGIGINVNQLDFDMGNVKTVVSMREILQQDVDLVKLLGEICAAIEENYFALQSRSYAVLKSAYFSALYKYREPGVFRDKNGLFEGMISAVEQSGQLVITVNKDDRIYNFKEVEFIL